MINLCSVIKRYLYNLKRPNDVSQEIETYEKIKIKLKKYLNTYCVCIYVYIHKYTLNVYNTFNNLAFY